MSDSYISLIPTTSLISGKLYLGSVSALNDLDKYNITFVISLFPAFNCTIPEHITQVEYSISDTPQYSQKMNTILDQTTKLIHTHLTNGCNVLVHCFAGVSRSSTVVLDYLLQHTNVKQICNKEYISILHYIRKFRDVVTPNQGFATLLAERHNLII